METSRVGIGMWMGLYSHESSIRSCCHNPTLSAPLPISRLFLSNLEALLKDNMDAGANDLLTYPQLHFVPSGDQSFASFFQQTIIGGTSDDASHLSVTELISGSQHELNRGIRTPPDFLFGAVPNIPNACDGYTVDSFSHDTEHTYAGADAIGHGSFPFPDPNPSPLHPLTAQPTWNNVALDTSTHPDVTSSTYPVPTSSTGHSHLNPPLENNIGSPPVPPRTEGHLIAGLENFVYFLRWSAGALGFRLVPL